MYGVLLPLLMLAAAPQTPQDRAFRWVVKEVIPPQIPGAHDEFDWLSAHALGDADGDGIPALAFRGRIDVVQWATGEESLHTRFFDGLWTGDRKLWQRGIRVSEFRVGDDFSTEAAVLASPQGGLLVMGEGPYAPGLQLRDYASGALLRSLSGAGTREIRRAGDLDGDGWEDFFQVDSSFRVVAWSTASGTQLWSSSLPGALLYDLDVATGPGPAPDLNGDGLADLVVVSSEGNGSDWLLRAHSGADGSALWSANGPGGGYSHPHLACGPDWTGDGVADFVLNANDTLVAVDGATGVPQWTSNLDTLQSWLHPETHFITVSAPPALTRRPEAPSQIDLVLPVDSLSGVGGNFTVTRSLFHVAAVDSQVRHRDAYPADIQPWGTDALRAKVQRPQLLGDVDRDGLEEFAVDVPVEVPGAALGREFSAYAILGQRTLHAPAVLAPGESARVQIMLPGAAKRPWVLAVSEVADPAGGGFQPQGWHTHLAPTPLFTVVLQQRPWQGTLDAAGQATFTLTLPQAPALIGTVLTMKALVPDGVGGLWTASTLAVTEIAP